MNPTFDSIQQPVMMSVVIPMMENRDDTLGAILGRISRLENPRTEIILIANTTCREERARYAVQLPGRPVVKWAVISHNIGVAAAWNLGLALAEGDVVLFLNDDAVPDCETMARMGYTLMKQPDVGVVGVEGHDFEWAGPPPMERPNAGCFRGFRSFGIDPARPHWTVPPADGVDTMVVTGHCFAAKRDDLIALNGFDLRYSPAFAEEYDFCFRMREQLKKRVLTIPGNVKHKVGASKLGLHLMYLTGTVDLNAHIVYSNWLFHRRWHPDSPEHGK